jgi:hypothetical protein
MSGGSRKQPCSVRIPLLLPNSVSITDMSQVKLSKPCREGRYAKNNCGYRMGWCPERKKTVGEHVLACERAHGPKPGDKYQVNHKCENRGCVEPEHLEWLTGSEHCKITARNRPKAHTLWTRDEKIAVAQRYLVGGETHTEIGKSLGLHPNRSFYWVKECLEKGWLDADGMIPYDKRLNQLEATAVAAAA